MTTYTPQNVMPITAWAEEDRPREKMMAIGKQNLSDAELIAILLNSGSREETAVSLAKRLLSSVENNLDSLGKQSLKSLQEFKGIGEAKAITIAAAMELGRRRQFIDMNDRAKIGSSFDSYKLLAPKLMDLPHEEFWILALDRSLRVKSIRLVSKGGYHATVVDVKMVFREAMQGEASCIVLCHNHPSGNCFPSEEDIRVTKKIQEAAKFLEMQILDHVIIAVND